MIRYQMRSLLGSWDRNSLTNVSPVCGPSERISALEVGVAIEKMKQGKSVGLT